MVRIKHRKTGGGVYTEKDLNDVITVAGIEYIKDKDDGTPLQDIILSHNIPKERAILVNGHIYDVYGIYEWMIDKYEATTDPVTRAPFDENLINRISELFLKTADVVSEKQVNAFNEVIAVKFKEKVEPGRRILMNGREIKVSDDTGYLPYEWYKEIQNSKKENVNIKDFFNKTAPSMGGGASSVGKLRYNGKLRRVHVGPRGGRFVVVNRKKMYV